MCSISCLRILNRATHSKQSQISTFQTFLLSENFRKQPETLKLIGKSNKHCLLASYRFYSFIDTKTIFFCFRMSGKSTPKSSTPRSTPPRMTPTRTSPPRGTTPTRLHASKIALTQAKVASPPAVGHPHSHSLSMLGAERYQNQLSSTANAELFK